MPTEAEWEYAARGLEDRTFPWGKSSIPGNLANFADERTSFAWRDTVIDDGFAESAPVGSYPRGASPFGIEDMAGNVFEWCWDCFESYKGKERVNPRGTSVGPKRIYRGGSWKSKAGNLRASARQFQSAGLFIKRCGLPRDLRVRNVSRHSMPAMRPQYARREDKMSAGVPPTLV